MLSWLPTILGALAAAAAVAVPDLAAQYPQASALLLAGLAIINALVKSPIGKK